MIGIRCDYLPNVKPMAFTQQTEVEQATPL